MSVAMSCELLIQFVPTSNGKQSGSLAIVWHLDSDLPYTGLVVAEILRRFVWNFFRVEYQQILRSDDN